MIERDVVVLGAGAAGLTAAAELVAHDLEPIVLDARDRVGGRVLTLRDPDTPVAIELGAEIVHEGAEAAMKLLREAHAALRPIDGAALLREDGVLRSLDDLDEAVARGLRAAAAELGGDDDDVPFADALARARLPDDVRRLARAFVEGFHAADVTRIGTRALARGGCEGPGRSLRVDVGYRAVVDLLAARLGDRVRLGATVTKVTRDGRGVEVEASGAPLVRARAAIVALPLGVLAAPAGATGAVVFDPPLSARARGAMSALAVGDVVKITLRFRAPFWRDRGAPSVDHAAFVLAPEEAFPTFWFVRSPSPGDAPVVVAWCGGPRARRLAELSPDDAAAEAAATLARALGVDPKRGRDALAASFTHDWSADPFARGAYSYPLVGGAFAADALAEPDGPLFFAGEHTCPPPENGTVHGAIDSGRRAARAVVAALDPVSGRASAPPLRAARARRAARPAR